MNFFIKNEGRNLVDCSKCIAICSKNCARKNFTSGIQTVSDFTEICESFEKPLTK